MTTTSDAHKTPSPSAVPERRGRVERFHATTCKHFLGGLAGYPRPVVVDSSTFADLNEALDHWRVTHDGDGRATQTAQTENDVAP